MQINKNFQKIESSYLFSGIAKKVREYKAANPDKADSVISLGIGDVTRPLAPACIEAMHKAADEMANAETFRGYPPEYGQDFLLEAILQNDYLARGIALDKSEIFVSDGAKSDYERPRRRQDRKRLVEHRLHALYGRKRLFAADPRRPCRYNLSMLPE